ncbi:hypothetical protein AX16_006106 [Volvariella volvacea WC 439]|nr:hypothetical protein AX16_006106 [Volvariella volvacea WC 439]
MSGLGSNVYVKYEETASSFEYSDSGWTRDKDWIWSEGEAMQFSEPGEFVFSFRGGYQLFGTSVAFVGSTPIRQSPLSATVTIDDNIPYNITYSGYPLQLPRYRQWYQSPVLPDGEHRITVSSFVYGSLDYAVVTAGESTRLQDDDALVIVDENDINHFKFVGNWTRDRTTFDSDPFTGRGLPFRNATRRSHTVGDQMFFRFVGTSVSLYGIFDWSEIGSFFVDYSIDGAPITDFESDSGPSPSPNTRELPNYPLFSLHNLAPGQHTLALTVRTIRNQTLIVDYATYKPSFSSTRDMPVLGPFASAHATSSKDKHVGAIVGAVVGGVALVVIGSLVAWLLIRRRRLNREKNSGNTSAPIPLTKVPTAGLPRLRATRSQDTFTGTLVEVPSRDGRDKEFDTKEAL